MKIYAISDLHLSGENVTKPMDIFGSYSTGYVEEFTNNWDAVAMTHYPPFDSVLADSGFTALFNEYNVNKVVYGHLHGQHIQTPLYYVKQDIEYYLTSCDKVNNTLVRIL